MGSCPRRNGSPPGSRGKRLEMLPSSLTAHFLVRLPLDNIMIVCSELFPKIQELQASLSGPTANTAIVDLLRSAALEHHLPKPPSLPARRFAVSSPACCCLVMLIETR